MSTTFASSAWHDAIAALISSDTLERTADTLIDAIGQAVTHEGTCMLAFHADAPPEVLHHTLEPAGEIHYVDRYIAGPYLLDPLYELAMRDDLPGICRFRDEVPDRFHSSEYYRQYCERTHLKDEMDYLLSVDATTTLALVIGRRERRFTKAELRNLRLIETTVHAAMQKIWDLSRNKVTGARRDTAIHARLTECLNNFGGGLLTQREQQTTQLLLRGYSTKAIARRLDIAPGTVMVHKRNLFRKLGITSQYELFSQFISTLSAE